MIQDSPLGRKYEVIERNSIANPKKFIIFEEIIEKTYTPKIPSTKYDSNLLLRSDMCRGTVTFRYLKRTKCIIEIINVNFLSNNELSLLSKEISYVLHQGAGEYGLEMDEEGWILVYKLWDAFRSTRKWKMIREQDLIEAINQSKKRNCELSNGKIRAIYRRHNFKK